MASGSKPVILTPGLNGCVGRTFLGPRVIEAGFVAVQDPA